MDSRCLTHEIRVIGADNDTCVSRLLVVQADEVFAIEREHRTPKADRQRQDFLVLNGLLRFSGFGHSQHIMSQSSELLDNGAGEVLVGVQNRHGSGILVVTNLLLDFGAVCSNVCPRVDNVFCP